MEQGVKKRNPLVDVLKGFAIILVVMGHATQWFTGDDRTHPLYMTIYAFHMPLFMFLSGYVSWNTRGQMDLHKRFQVLVIPFFVWFFISAAYHQYLFDFAKVWQGLKNLIYDPTKGMWFLWLLFWECVLLNVALIIKKHSELWTMIGLWSILIFLHRLTGAQMPYYGLPELCWYFVYFTLGYALHRYELRAVKQMKSIGWTSVLLFPLLLLLQVDKGNYILYAMRLYALALTGIAAVYVLGQWFCQWDTKAKQCLQYLGGISLEIYVTHYYFHFLTKYISGVLGDNVYLNVLSFAVLAIIGSDLMQRIIRYNKWLRRILYGRF